MNCWRKHWGRVMSEPTKTLVPKLRFPEFQDAGEWEEKALGDLSQIVRGGSPRPIDEYITSDINGLNWLKIADVDKDSKYVTFTKERVLATALSKTREVNPGDLIMSNSMSFGRPYIVKIKSCIHDGWIAVTQINKQASRDYLYYLILSPISQEYFVNNAAGSGVQNLNADIIKLLPVVIPKYSEQQKIADCLSSIDELIAAQINKVAALKNHKKALMQQLFPLEGETTPKLRFPDFSSDKEWLPTTIGKLGKFYYGKSAPKWSLSNDAPTLCVRYGELYTKFGTVISEVTSRTNIEPSNLKFSKGGEILIPRVGEDPQDFANCCYLPFPDIAIGEMISVYETEENSIFYSYYFRTMRKQFAKVVEGQNVKNLYYTNLEPIVIGKPSSRLEQQKIADCFFSIDELITAQTQKLESYKAHKKGLMQQLFPNADEVGE